MSDYSNTWDPFKKAEGNSFVLILTPKSLAEAYIRCLALKLGREVPAAERPKTRIPCLYAEPFKSGGWTMAVRGKDPHEEMKDAAPCYEVPAWLLGMETAFSRVRQKETDNDYERGVQDGKGFVRALAEGKMTVNEFEKKEGR